MMQPMHFVVTMTDRYMVDAADSEKLEAARQELHALLEKPQLAGSRVYICSTRLEISNQSPIHNL